MSEYLMPANEYTPVRSRRGTVVHASLPDQPQHTACGRPTSGWVIGVEPLTCRRCMAVLVVKR